MTQTRSSFLERLFAQTGRTALVTGAGGGIGRVLALALAEAGADVAIHDLKLDMLADVSRQIRQIGRKVVPLAANLADISACRNLIADAHRALGRLDILINCAGMNRRKPIDDVTTDDYEIITAVNLRAIYFLSQSAHPIMKAQGGGKIVNVGSLNSSIGLGTVSVYGLTKAAVAQLTKTQAVEWAKDNIQVNCLAPGYMLTPLTEKSLWGDPHKSQWLIGRIPMRRPGKPEELVSTVLAMVAPASSYLTGQLVTVDGGVLAGGSWEQD